MDACFVFASLVLFAVASLRFGVDSRPDMESKDTFFARHGYRW